jgi:ribosomal protein S18 acetylase RimI-like enzyme
MIAQATGALRFTLDLPSSHEPRRYKARPLTDDDARAADDLMRHAPGVNRHIPPTQSPEAATARIGVFDDMRVLRAFIDLRAGAPTADCCFVELMVVDPRYRRAGLGTHMFNELAAEMKAAGARRIALEVDHDNEGAARFWTRLGFTEGERRGDQRTFERRLT